MDAVDYYELLGLTPAATAEEIKKAYRVTCRQVHPDTGGNAGMFRLVQLAYETLSDEQARARYDAGHRTGVPSPGTGDPAPGADSGPGFGSRTGPTDDDTFPAGSRTATASATTVDPGRLSWPARLSGLAETVRVVPRSWAFLPRLWWGLVAAMILLGATVVALLYTGPLDLAGLVAAVVVLGVSASFWHRGWLLAVAAGAALVAAGVAPPPGAWPVQLAWWSWVASAVAATGVYVTRHHVLDRSLDALIPEQTARRYVEFGSFAEPWGAAADEWRRVAARVGADAAHLLTAIPGVRVLHKVTCVPARGSLDFGGHGADQVAVCGDRVAVLVHRAWLPGRYTWTPNGHVLCNGGHFPGGDVVDPVRDAQWRAQLPKGTQYRVWVVVSSATGPVLCEDQVAPEGYTLAGVQEMVEQVGSWFLDGTPGVVDRRTLLVFARGM